MLAVAQETQKWVQRDNGLAEILDAVRDIEWIQYLDILFREHDANGDGVLDEQEYAAMARTDRLFEEAKLPYYDANKDGKVTLEEMTGTHNVAFKTEDVADNLKNQGGFVPGIRPGIRTQEYLDYVVNRVLVLGSAYLAAVCLFPEIVRDRLGVPFYFGGTSVLIVVSVVMDTINQVQSHLLAHQYEGLIEKSQLRGKRGKNGTPRPKRAPARR